MIMILPFILGCCLGSFFCLIAERVPEGKSILLPASHCPYCEQRLAIYEMIPLLSITTQHFRCRSCSKQLPIIYFISELAGGLLCAFSFAQGLHPSSLYLFLFLSMGLLLSLTDCFYMIVEPKLLFSFSTVLLLWHLWFSLPLYPWSCLALTAFLYSFHRFFPQSIGGGDILLLCSWSLLLSWEEILFLVFTASSMALLYIASQYWLGKKTKQIPFVPFLSLGLWSVFLFR